MEKSTDKIEGTPAPVKPVERKSLGRGLAALLGGGDNLPFVSTHPPISQKVETIKVDAPIPAVTPVAVEEKIEAKVIVEEKVPEVVVAPVSIPVAETAAPIITLEEKIVPAPTDLDYEYQVRRLSIDSIRPNIEQPRQHFADSKLNELAESICEQGLIQPIIVRRNADQSYQIVAGERRWRACKMLGMNEIPAIVRDETEHLEKSDLASVIENIQRVELNPVELADAYSKIIKNYNYTQENLAKKLGVSRVSIANTLRLQRLPGFVKEAIVQNKLSEGHARALLTLEKEEEIVALAQEAIDQAMNVREVEARVRAKIQGTAVVLPSNGQTQGASASTIASAKPQEPKKAEVLAAEEELRGIFGAKVQICGNAKGGTVEIFYSNDDSLNRILHQLRTTQR